MASSAQAKSKGLGGYPEIPDQRRFTISETSDLCNVKPHILRYWEKIYKQMRKIERRNSRRYYTVEDVLRIRAINDLKQQGLNAKAISSALDGKGVGSDGVRAQVIEADKIRAEIEGVIKLLD